MKLGDKLRAIRQEQHLTQEAAAGDFITRNMLSRIETGDASPSLETLRYLSDRLGVPVGYLLSEDELSVCRLPAILDEIRIRYKAGDYSKAEALCLENGISTDESELILCDISCRKGKKAFSEGKFTEAAAYFDAAEIHAQKTAYPADMFRANILLYRALLSESAGEPNDELLSSYGTLLSESAGTERWLLAVILNAVVEGREAPGTEALLSPVYRAAAQACRAGRDNDCERVISLLTPIIDDPLIQNDPVLFPSLAKLLETSSASVGDFETAYRFAQKRLEHS